LTKKSPRSPSLPVVVLTFFFSSFMYSLAANATGLTVLSVDGPGQAEIYQRVDIAGPAKAVNLSLREQLLC
jgi:hypothetical protein